MKSAKFFLIIWIRCHEMKRWLSVGGKAQQLQQNIHFWWHELDRVGSPDARRVKTHRQIVNSSDRSLLTAQDGLAPTGTKVCVVRTTSRYHTINSHLLHMAPLADACSMCWIPLDLKSECAAVGECEWVQRCLVKRLSVLTDREG